MCVIVCVCVCVCVHVHVKFMLSPFNGKPGGVL